jgi:hypothetical protein
MSRRCERTTSPPARRRRIDDGDLGVTPASRFARTPARTKLSRTGLGSSRSPSRACEWPCLRGCAGARSRRRAISDRLRSVGAGLDRLLVPPLTMFGQQPRRPPQRIDVAPRRAGSREPPREPDFSRTRLARRPRGPGSSRSPSRACEWPCLRGCAGARSRPGR